MWHSDVTCLRLSLDMCYFIFALCYFTQFKSQCCEITMVFAHFSNAAVTSHTSRLLLASNLSSWHAPYSRCHSASTPLPHAETSEPQNAACNKYIYCILILYIFCSWILCICHSLRFFSENLKLWYAELEHFTSLSILWKSSKKKIDLSLCLPVDDPKCSELNETQWKHSRCVNTETLTASLTVAPGIKQESTNIYLKLERPSNIFWFGL